MTINIGKLELELAKKIAATTDNQDLLALSTAIKKLNNTAVDYIDTYANLPAATTTNAGRMYYVASEQAIYWSTGTINEAMTNAVACNTLWGVGYNVIGQLGTGNTTSYSSPVTTAGGGTNWRQVSVGAGAPLSAAIKTDGTLWTWGRNTSGGLGNNSIVDKSSPVTTAGGGTTWCQVTNGGDNTAAIKTDGTLWVWGEANAGVLGTGDITDRSSPVTTAGGGTTWCQVSAGQGYMTAIKTDGTLWTWGYGGYGQLGTGDGVPRSSPGTTAGGGTTWCQVSGSKTGTISQGHTGAIKTNGTIWMWGYNLYGQLGTGNTTHYYSPISISTSTNWCQVSVGANITASIKTDGTLYAWGCNTYGQLGTGNTTNYCGPTTTAGGGTTWCKVSAGGTMMSAIKTDGTLWTWGINTYGQLGTGNTTNYSSPVTVVGGINTWCDVAVTSHLLAINHVAY